MKETTHHYRQHDTLRKRRMKHTTHKTPRGGNVSFMRLVDDVTDSVITQSEFAAAVGASERTVQNWSRGQTRPRGDAANRVLDLVHLVSELREVYTDEGIQIWLKSRNRNLHSQRPIDLLAAGEIDEVLDEVQRVIGGM
ncbi:MAG: MbcA/ParS/Xre antitoxin family protein [Candidatus Nanopelagicales bacterium]